MIERGRRDRRKTESRRLEDLRDEELEELEELENHMYDQRQGIQCDDGVRGRQSHFEKPLLGSTARATRTGRLTQPRASQCRDTNWTCG